MRSVHGNIHINISKLSVVQTIVSAIDMSPQIQTNQKPVFQNLENASLDRLWILVYKIK